MPTNVIFVCCASWCCDLLYHLRPSVTESSHGAFDPGSASVRYHRLRRIFPGHRAAHIAYLLHAARSFLSLTLCSPEMTLDDEACGVPWRTLEPMKNRLFHGPAILQMLDDNSLEQLWSDVGVPDSLRVHDDDRATATNAEARGFASFHATRSEEQILPLE